MHYNSPGNWSFPLLQSIKNGHNHHFDHSAHSASVTLSVCFHATSCKALDSHQKVDMGDVVLDIRSDPSQVSVCCTNEGETGTDESAHILMD